MIKIYTIDRSPDEINKFRQTAEITVKGNNVPNPIQHFQEGNFPPYIMEGIKKQGFTQPTAIQSQGWPIALSGRDLVAIAQTGSGKTLGVRNNKYLCHNLSFFFFFKLTIKIFSSTFYLRLFILFINLS